MSEIHHADDAEDHGVADGDQAVDRAERDAVDELLDEDFHARAPCRGVPHNPAMKLYQGAAGPATPASLAGAPPVGPAAAASRSWPGTKVSLRRCPADSETEPINGSLRVALAIGRADPHPAGDLGVRRVVLIRLRRLAGPVG